MKLLKSSLLGTAAGFAAVAGAQAADLPVKKAAPIEYVRICSAYGAGFFYIPGTDTCLRISGRARLELGYSTTESRSAGFGDQTGYRGLARINLDARTQTGYGTLRAFVRAEFASRSGFPSFASGTQVRGANAFFGTGQDQIGRLEQFFSTEKAFIQFAGFTAGRASSFFDFYAHDFEFSAATAGSDVPSTNLLAYTAQLGNGFSASLSLEDPVFRRTGIFSQAYSNAGITNSAGFGAGNAGFGSIVPITTAPNPVFLVNAAGVPVAAGFVDSVERSRLPDFVGVLRYDAPWGSAQLSAAVKELNVGNFIQNAYSTVPGGLAVANNTTTAPFARGRTPNEYGWAVQGGVKVNLPFIAPGDALYLQGAYGEGATIYTGYQNFTATYITQSSNIYGPAFNQYLADASLNPLTNRIQLSTSFTASAAYLHYWAPEWRSAFFGSYGELAFAPGARLANAVGQQLTGAALTGSQFSGVIGNRSFALSPVLRDNYQFVAGASLIWSPVKDLDIGVEGFYTQIGLQRGRAIDYNKNQGVTAATVANPAIPVRTANTEDAVQVRMRVQRDF